MTTADTMTDEWPCGCQIGGSYCQTHTPRTELPSEPCVFCDIVDGKAPAEVVFRDATGVVIVPLNPVVPGHVIAIPEQHVQDAAESHLVTAHTMALAVQHAREQGGPFNLITSAGDAATQSVFHLHIHYVPRAEGDGLTLPWTGQGGWQQRALAAEAELAEQERRTTAISDKFWAAQQRAEKAEQALDAMTAERDGLLRNYSQSLDNAQSWEATANMRWGMVLSARERAEKAEAAIQRMLELCATAKPGLSADPLDCKNTCLDSDCTCSGNRRTLAWTLDPAAVLAALGDDTATAMSVKVVDEMHDGKRLQIWDDVPAAGDTADTGSTDD